MREKKRKKSFIGWVYTAWKEHMFFSESVYREDEAHQRILEIPAIRKYASVEGGSIHKIRITIEEI